MKLLGVLQFTQISLQISNIDSWNIKHIIKVSNDAEHAGKKQVKFNHNFVFSSVKKYFFGCEYTNVRSLNLIECITLFITIKHIQFRMTLNRKGEKDKPKSTN